MLHLEETNLVFKSVVPSVLSQAARDPQKDGEGGGGGRCGKGFVPRHS